MHSAALLQQAGFAVEWHSYPIGHGVGPDEIRDVGDWLSRRFAKA
jgi:phospholipase/carboxylesterase